METLISRRSLPKWLLLALALLLVAGPAWAQPSPTLVTTHTDGASATSYTIPSHTLPADRLITLAFTQRDNDGAPAPTVSSVTGHSLTWTLEHSLELDANNVLWLYCAKTTSGSTDTIAVSFGADTQVAFGASVVEWSGADLSGSCTAALLQDVTTLEAGRNNVNPATITFGAYGSSNNRPYTVWRQIAEGTSSPEAGWTELFDVATASTDALTHMGMWRNDTSDTTAVMTPTGGGSRTVGGHRRRGESGCDGGAGLPRRPAARGGGMLIVLTALA